ncbi:Protein Aster-B [Gaertneriomyces sp. JEL0708]|nr:Protein Aster-B [Gaertneriomyces sp. JEL0708]
MSPATLFASRKSKKKIAKKELKEKEDGQRDDLSHQVSRASPKLMPSPAPLPSSHSSSPVPSPTPAAPLTGNWDSSNNASSTRGTFHRLGESATEEQSVNRNSKTDHVVKGGVTVPANPVHEAVYQVTDPIIVGTSTFGTPLVEDAKITSSRGIPDIHLSDHSQSVPLGISPGPAVLEEALVEGSSISWPRQSPKLQSRERMSQTSQASTGGLSRASSLNERTSGENHRVGRTSSKKSTRDIIRFVKLFPELAERDEILSSTYNCALERDGFCQGKLYITNAHCCFYGKVFTRSTKITIKLADLLQVEKKYTVGMFPNALRLTVQGGDKYVFTSFLKRDSAYRDLMDFWKAAVEPDAKQEGPVADVVKDPTVSRAASQGQRDAVAGFSNSTSARSSSSGAHTPPVMPESFVVDGDPVAVSPEVVLRPDSAIQATVALNSELPRDIRSGSPDPNLSGTMQTEKAPGTFTRQTRALTIAGSIDFLRRMLPGYGDEDIEAPYHHTHSSAADHGNSYQTERWVLDNSSTRLDIPSPAVVPAVSPSGKPPVSPASFEGSVRSSSDTTELLQPAPITSVNAKPMLPTPSDSKPPIVRPNEAVMCSCEAHLDYKIVDVMLDLDVEVVFGAIFGSEGSEIVREAHRRTEKAELVFGDWTDDPQNQTRSRDLTYSVTFKPPMLAKQTTTGYEKQVITRSDPYRLYVVQGTVRTPKAPYGENFSSVSRYCITHAASGKTRLLITARVDFSKRLMWKSQIESATVEGITQWAQELVALIRRIGDRAKTGDLDSAPKRDEALASESTATATVTPTEVAGRIGVAATPDGSVLSSVAHFITQSFVAVFPSLSHSQYVASVSRQPTLNEKRTAFALLLLLGLLLIGFTITAMNIYWVIDVGRRLDKTLMSVEKRGGNDPWNIQRDAKYVRPFGDFVEEDLNRGRLHLLHQAHSQLNAIQDTLHEAGIRSAMLLERLEAMRRRGGTVRDEFLTAIEATTAADQNTYTETQKPQLDPQSSQGGQLHLQDQLDEVVHQLWELLGSDADPELLNVAFARALDGYRVWNTEANSYRHGAEPDSADHTGSTSVS